MSFSNHNFILKNDSTLWGCGYNGYGQLGLGDTSNRTTFTQITTNADDIKSVHCGYSHTFILKNNGTLCGCGYNGYGALGLGDTTNRTTFTIANINTNDIKSIYCGYNYTFIIKNNGTLWGCGYNGYGQLGLGDVNNRNVFTIIGINTNDIKSVYGGYYHTFILKNDGTLWGCGKNDYGQLGLGDTSNRIFFTQITTNADDIKSVHCGNEYTVILKNDGTLWGCGRNYYSELGLGDDTYRKTFTQITTNTDNIKSVYSCGAHITILKNDNTLWGCGNNANGQLGLGDSSGRNKFTKITDDVKSAYGGYNHTLILKNNGTLWGSGNNGDGELGLGNTNGRTIFTQVTVNADNIKCFANDYPNTPSTIKIYDSKIGYTETLETNNFRNIPVDKFEKLKVLYAKPLNTYANCLISLDKKQTWKTFNGTTWTTVSDISPENIILNCMDIETLNNLTKQDLVKAGFTGDLDFKVVIKTNNEKVTPSITKIYIIYKNSF